MALSDDIQHTLGNLTEFISVTRRVLSYFPEIITKSHQVGKYVLNISEVAGTTKYVRPINTELFLYNINMFNHSTERFINILKNLKSGSRNFNQSDYEIINSVSYTIQQSLGLGLDLLVEPNSARKHIGNRFEEFIKAVVEGLGISCKKIVLSIPYDTDEGIKHYRCETDLVVSPYKKVSSDNSNIDEAELVISVKTTTK
ncbi:MAG: hypothetical protein P8X42_11595, partial [Calditrichaceae bacterium]